MSDIVELFSKAKPGDIICIPSSNLYRYFGSSDEASAFINHIVHQADRHGLTVTIECDPCMDEYKIVITDRAVLVTANTPANTVDAETDKTDATS